MGLTQDCPLFLFFWTGRDAAGTWLFLSVTQAASSRPGESMEEAGRILYLPSGLKWIQQGGSVARVDLFCLLRQEYSLLFKKEKKKRKLNDMASDSVALRVLHWTPRLSLERRDLCYLIRGRSQPTCRWCSSAPCAPLAACSTMPVGNKYHDHSWTFALVHYSIPKSLSSLFSIHKSLSLLLPGTFLAALIWMFLISPRSPNYSNEMQKCHLLRTFPKLAHFFMCSWPHQQRRSSIAVEDMEERGEKLLPRCRSAIVLRDALFTWPQTFVPPSNSSDSFMVMKMPFYY